MMSEILRDEALMSRMVSTTWPTTFPPCTAMVEALTASWLAVRALSAFCRTVEPSSSMDAAVCSSALACDSVRADRSLFPWAISALAVATPSEPWRTLDTTETSDLVMASSAVSSCATSSLPWVLMAWVRSPLATACATSTALLSDRERLRSRVRPNIQAMTSPTTMDTMEIRRMVW